MNTLVLFQQMLMLFAMMVTGFIAFKMHVFDSVGQHQISKIVVNVLNPFLMLSAISGDRAPGAMQLSFQNLIASAAFYLFFIIASYIFYFIRDAVGKKERNELKIEQLMMILSNIGFFGVPVVKALFGDEYVIYLIFYMLIFNLVAYTLGIFLVMPYGSLSENQFAQSARPHFAGESDADLGHVAHYAPQIRSTPPQIGDAHLGQSVFGQSSGEGAQRFSPRQIINTGTVISFLAIVLYFAEIPIHETVGNFFTYLGNACIPLSMLLIGASLAQSDLKDIFTDKEAYVYILLRNIIVPAAGILILRMLPFDPAIVKICCLSASMPIAALSGMLSEQYAHKGNYANKMIAMSTILSVITVPLLSLLYL